MKFLNNLTLIAFFCLLICIILLPMILKNSNLTKKDINLGAELVKNEIRKSESQLLKEVMQNKQVIKLASQSGNIICSKEDPSICNATEEGKVLEYDVGCTHNTSSSSIYICKKGRWEYVDWTDNSSCNFCKQ